LSGSDRVYLDHAATTPVLPQARAAVARAFEKWANPSSPHAEGRAARALLEEARSIISDALGWRHDVIFTSGASEAIEIAAKRARVSGRAHGATEHPIVPYAMGADSKVIPVDGNGLVDEDALDRVLADGPALVAIQQVNNETGVIQPLERIGAKVRAAGSLLLADCAQSAGKLPLPGADFLVIAAHKLGGPPGIGALLAKDPATLEAIGGQEGGYRPGTPAVPSIMGFAAALEADHGWYEEAKRLRAHLDAEIEAAHGEVVAGAAPRIATIACYRMPGVPGAAQMMQLDLAGIAVSAGSACASGSLKTSHVLAAMGWHEEKAREVIRISFGAQTRESDIDTLLTEYRALIGKRRAA